MVDNPLYDTSLVELPIDWNRLEDGRIISNSAVFYTNGTMFSFEDSQGLTY